MFAVIDRFEGDFAVVQRDDGKILNIKKSFLPGKAREGDVIDLNKMIVDERETLSRKAEIRKLAENILR
jgi:hypothetical protein